MEEKKVLEELDAVAYEDVVNPGVESTLTLKEELEVKLFRSKEDEKQLEAVYEDCRQKIDDAKEDVANARETIKTEQAFIKENNVFIKGQKELLPGFKNDYLNKRNEVAVLEDAIKKL